MAEASRRIGVSEQTFYRWRTEYGGLLIDQARRLKQLETENGRGQRPGRKSAHRVVCGHRRPLGERFVAEKLTELAERRAALERGVAELEQQLARVQDKAVTAEVVRAALSQVHQVYACLKPYEQRELVRLSITPRGGTCERTGFRDQWRRRAGNHACDGQQWGRGSPDTGLAPRAGLEPTT